ncbi:MAG: hypothetical protein M3340_14085, partial [Actinomycetota bacterium]|nr:hypothetical protein [Actinomycetota bacterium]
MTTPRNRTSLGLPVIGLLAVILFLGLILAPRAFQFRAWPEPARQIATEAMVQAPAEDAAEIHVAGVSEDRSRADGRTARVRRGEVREDVLVAREDRSRRGADRDSR